MSVSTGPVPEQAQLVALSLRGAFRRVLEQLLPYYVHQSHCTPRVTSYWKHHEKTECVQVAGSEGWIRKAENWEGQTLKRSGKPPCFINEEMEARCVPDQGDTKLQSGYWRYFLQLGQKPTIADSQERHWIFWASVSLSIKWHLQPGILPTSGLL